MKAKTSRFWFIATVVLATMYLTSNPTLTGKVGSQLAKLWQEVITKVKVPQTPSGTVSPKQQKTLKSSQRVGPDFEEQRAKRSDPQEELASGQTVRAGADDKGEEKVVQENQRQGTAVDEVRMQDILIEPQEKPPAGVSGGPAIDANDMELETVKEIYARHLEALKILNSEAGSEKDEK